VRTRKQKLQLLSAAALSLVFIAGMIALALTLSSKSTHTPKINNQSPLTGPVSVLHASTIPASGRFTGNYLSFSFPKGASALTTASADNSEVASFRADGESASVSTEAAPAGFSLTDLIAANGKSEKPISLPFGHGYIASDNGEVVLTFYHEGRFIFVQTRGAVAASELALATQLLDSLKVAAFTPALSSATG